MTGDERWVEVGTDTFVRRHRAFDLNIGLVVGADAALVIDTRESLRAGEKLLGAIREVTTKRLIIANTHAHFDHCFGNGAFGRAAIWAYDGCIVSLRRFGELQRQRAIELYREAGKAEFADELAATPIVLPTQGVSTGTPLDVGGRTVWLQFLGRAHTDSDLVVEVPDAGVLFAGDIIEEGAPPAYADAYPLDWPGTVDELAEIALPVVVPGHGGVVDPAYLRKQGAEVAALVTLAERGFNEGATVDDLVTQGPWDERANREALERAFRQLRGERMVPEDPT